MFSSILSTSGGRDRFRGQGKTGRYTSLKERAKEQGREALSLQAAFPLLHTGWVGRRELGAEFSSGCNPACQRGREAVIWGFCLGTGIRGSHPLSPWKGVGHTRSVEVVHSSPGHAASPATSCLGGTSWRLALHPVPDDLKKGRPSIRGERWEAV